MSKELRVVKAEARSDRGKGPARRLRKTGRVPAVIYGRGKEPRALTVERGEVERLVRNNERMIRLAVGSEESHAMVKEIQYEPVTRLVSHVDFLEVSATETITVSVPIRVRGVPEGAKEGGVLALIMHEIEVEGRLADIPDDIRVEVAALKMGEGLRAGALQLPPGLTLVTDADSTVVTVERPRLETDAEAKLAPEAGAAGPEVLTARKDEEGEEAAAAGEAAPKEKAPAAKEAAPKDAAPKAGGKG